ncbi:hypothetical protein [Desulfonema magnum]|nr:hypothetical protein [Desulfonema magnum]
MAEMVGSMAMGIAEAQFDLDMTSTRIAEMMTGKYKTDDGETMDTMVMFNDQKLSLLELGFTPSFYQFVEAVLDIKVSVSINQDQTSEQEKTTTTTKTKTKRHGFLGLGGSTTTTKVTTVSARFSSRFQYSAEGASVIRTKMVPVPPPSILQDRMRELAEENK